MARIASRQIAGYYPTPTHLLPRISTVLRWPEPPLRPTYLLDPCAGDGAAILGLRDQWTSQWWGLDPDDSHDPHARVVPHTIVACEMEAERAGLLDDALPEPQDRAFHADSFLLHPSHPGTDRATVLFLNPPYDQDPEYGRLEHRFLLRFTQMLHEGAGALLFLLPAHALTASAEHLARNFLDVRAWRFPGEDFESFGQVLLVARRSATPLTDTTLVTAIRRWAEDPYQLPELPEVCPDPLELDLDPFPPFDLTLFIERFDIKAAIEAHRPLGEEVVGLRADATELLGAKFETAAPPKPAHIALALSSGMFNGWPLEANDPQRHPPLLAKGVFERENVLVSERTNKEGDVTGIVEIEQPRLRLTVLRLDEMSFHELEPGTVPTESEDVSEWNAADLITNYDRSLARLLGRQFPALHDPTRPEHEIALPQLARRPFAVQSQAIETSLKLLASERNPMLVAEVGTGKTTMALMIAAALSPDHYQRTVQELRRVGLTGKPPRVEKTLVVCPPHLLGTWAEEAAAVVPHWRVQLVRSPSDLKQPAEVYVLSRETAKLGHAWAGIEKGSQCPRCGAEVETAATTNASTRRVCPAVPRRPINLAARLAEDLATVLLPAAPSSGLLHSLVRAPALLRHFDPEAEEQPIVVTPLATLTRTLACAVAAIREEPDSPHSRDPHALARALRILARVTGLAEEVLEILPAKNPYEPSWLLVCRNSLSTAASDAEAPSPDLSELLRTVEALQQAGTWHEGPPCGEPLFQARPKPRRVPLADVIRRHHLRDFQLVILDEAHEYAHSSSAQSKAAHRLSGLPGAATVVLTGSLMGGYASSLFTNFWHLSPIFRKEFGRSEQRLFLDRYGYRKTLRIPDKEPSGSRRRGSYTDRDLDGRRTLGEAPGVMPTFVMRHLLPTAVLVHKDDLDCELPPITEEPAVLVADPEDDHDEEFLAEYTRIQTKLLQAVRQDRFHPERAGRLLGALVELPSYLDRATDDLPPFEVRYPETLGGDLVARAKSFPASWKTPKERWLLAELARLIERGEKVLIFLRHTGTPHLPQRLVKLIEELTPKVAWLDASKVTTGKRQKWIDRQVADADLDVLLVNPNAVRTGLNNLVTFSTGIWHQLDWSAQTYRQANGRFHRIGQTRPVSILIPYYQDTAQEVAFDLVARKVGASLQVDGLDLQAALEAAGASEDHTAAMATAMSLGQAVYKALTGGGPRRRPQAGRIAPKPSRELSARPAPKHAPASPPEPSFPSIAPTTAAVQLSLLEAI